MKYKAIIFDFFGVLCSEVSPQWFQEVFTEKANELRQKLMPSADRGEITQDELFARLAELSNLSAKEIEQDWIKRATINTALFNRVKELGGDYKLGLLSNSMSPLFRVISQDMDLDKVFDEVIISSEVGCAKPEPEVFQLMLKRLNVLPAEVMLIDDGVVNIKAAEDLGMSGCIFSTTEDVLEVLKNQV